MKNQKNIKRFNSLIVIPGNDPTHVENTTVAPYCYVGLLRMIFPNKKVYTGTATLIADGGAKDGKSCHLLTCAHNLYDEDDGGRAELVEFLPMFNGKPVGTSIVVSNFFYPELYPSTKADHLDYAIVKLISNITLEGIPSTCVLPTDELKNAAVELNGYGIFGKEMSHATGEIAVVTENMLKYPISTMKGASGTAIMKTANSKIVGIHTGGVLEEMLNEGVRITSEVQDNIDKWLKM